MLSDLDVVLVLVVDLVLDHVEVQVQVGNRIALSFSIDRRDEIARTC